MISDKNNCKSRIYDIHFINQISSRVKLLGLIIGIVFFSSCNGENKTAPVEPQTDPPPIIIKTGGFEFESPDPNTPLTDSTELASETKPQKDFNFKVKDFPIKKIQVCHINFISPPATPCQDVSVPNPPTIVQMWFANNSTSNPDLTVKQEKNAFDFTVINKPIKCKKTGSLKRTTRCYDNDPDLPIIVSRIKIGNEDFIPTEDDFYFVSFYR